MELQTTTGEGSAIVTVAYEASSDYDDFQSWVEIEITAVNFEGVNILAALSADQYEDLRIACESAAQVAKADAKADAAIEQWESRRDDELMGAY